MRPQEQSPQAGRPLLRLTGKISDRLADISSARDDRRAPNVWVMALSNAKASFFQRTDKGLEDLGTASMAGAPTVRNRNAFLSLVCGWLEVAAAAGAFDRLVLVAPQPCISKLHDLLPLPLYLRIAAEVRRPETAIHDPSLRAELEKIVWF